MEPTLNSSSPQSTLYETLSPLCLSPTAANDEAQPPPENIEGYAVFRNEISLTTAHCASSNTVATDFFSLNVGGPDDTVEPVPASDLSPVTLLPVAKTCEPKLESSWFRGNSKFKSPMLQLHKEIVDFCNFLSPTSEEEAARKTAVESVFDVIKYIWPNCEVEVFGSFKTGLYLPTSDIDVVILGSGIRSPQMGLQALSRALSQRGIAKKIQVIAKARVPIIKFVEKKSGVSFDLSFDVDNGPKAAEFIKDAVAKWPPLRPLCLILKVFLQQRELNEVYSGGIGSYALLAMLIAMLQSRRALETSPENNLGVLLVHFFDFYGRKLNTSDVGVSCRGKGTFFSKRNRGFLNKARPFLLSIEDPQAPDNDIGKNSFNYFQIRSAFAMAFSTLTNTKIILSLGPNKSILGTIIRPDTVLLERKGGSNGDVTFDSLLPGAGESVQPLYVDEQEMLGNWRLNDAADEVPLPRGGKDIGDVDVTSSGKKRKASKDKSAKSSKKVKENGERRKFRHEDSGSGKEKSMKKKRWRHSGRKANGFGSPWTH